MAQMLKMCGEVEFLERKGTEVENMNLTSYRNHKQLGSKCKNE